MVAGLALWSTGLSPSDVVRKLDCKKDRLGRIVTDDRLRVPSQPGVYAIGDCATIEVYTVYSMFIISLLVYNYRLVLFITTDKWRVCGVWLFMSSNQRKSSKKSAFRVMTFLRQRKLPLKKVNQSLETHCF